jgi:hypothetical protein
MTMKRAVERIGLAYGCAATIGYGAAWVWLWFSAAGPTRGNRGLFVSLAVIHLVNVAIAVQPSPFHPWRPVFRPTSGRVRLARAALTVGTVVFAAHVVVLVWPDVRDDARMQDWAKLAVSAWFMTLTSLYLTVHWALRPERVISRTLLTAVNPATRMLARVKRGRHAHELREQRRARPR